MAPFIAAALLLGGFLALGAILARPAARSPARPLCEDEDEDPDPTVLDLGEW